MAIYTASSFSKRTYQGDAGNLGVAVGEVTFGTGVGAVNAAIGDQINLFQLAAGMRINRVAIINAALGTGVTATVTSGAKVLVNAAGAATAGFVDQPLETYETLVDDETVFLTVAGGVPTGKVTVHVYYVPAGL